MTADCRMPFDPEDPNSNMVEEPLKTFFDYCYEMDPYERRLSDVNARTEGHLEFIYESLDPPEKKKPTRCWNFLDIPLVGELAPLTRYVVSVPPRACPRWQYVAEPYQCCR